MYERVGWSAGASCCGCRRCSDYPAAVRCGRGGWRLLEKGVLQGKLSLSSPRHARGSSPSTLRSSVPLTASLTTTADLPSPPPRPAAAADDFCADRITDFAQRLQKRARTGTPHGVPAYAHDPGNVIKCARGRRNVGESATCGRRGAGGVVFETVQHFCISFPLPYPFPSRSALSSSRRRGSKAIKRACGSSHHL